MEETRTSDHGAWHVGLGYDVHALVEERPLVIGGVHIPYERGLLGHSDADVLVHALADAVLGAMRAGDIGQLFPDTDPLYEGADSIVLLSQVARLMRTQGYRLVDADCVVVAQEPKLSPYRDAMRENLAQALGVSVRLVGIKATTTERLGFQGRGEGISAQAVVLLAEDATACCCTCSNSPA
jgi:2-C-methyl-D-erythritol 2,4-cyclodiphosphate synthase